MEAEEVSNTVFRGLVENYLSGSYRLWLLVEEMPERKIFSCKDCGKPFEAYPPDDIHTTASLESVDGAVQRTYKCSGDVKHENVIYWSSREPKVAFTRAVR
jgi:hypothetical protein